MKKIIMLAMVLVGLVMGGCGGGGSEAVPAQAWHEHTTIATVLEVYHQDDPTWGTVLVTTDGSYGVFAENDAVVGDEVRIKTIRDEHNIIKDKLCSVWVLRTEYVSAALVMGPQPKIQPVPAPPAFNNTSCSQQ